MYKPRSTGPWSSGKRQGRALSWTPPPRRRRCAVPRQPRFRRLARRAVRLDHRCSTAAPLESVCDSSPGKLTHQDKNPGVTSHLSVTPRPRQTPNSPPLLSAASIRPGRILQVALVTPPTNPLDFNNGLRLAPCVHPTTLQPVPRETRVDPVQRVDTDAHSEPCSGFPCRSRRQTHWAPSCAPTLTPHLVGHSPPRSLGPGSPSARSAPPRD